MSIDDHILFIAKQLKIYDQCDLYRRYEDVLDYLFFIAKWSGINVPSFNYMSQLIQNNRKVLLQ